MLYGYARVSTLDQSYKTSLITQRETLVSHGVFLQNIYVDVASGSNFTREKFQDLLKIVTAGDQILVASMDRFSRNSSEALLLISNLNKIGVKLRPLDVPMINGDPALQNFLYSIFLYLADFEAQQRKRRQVLGIAKARENGVKFGRKRIYSQKLLKDLLRILSKNLNLTETYSSLQLKKSTFYNCLKLILSDLTNDLIPLNYRKLSASRKQEIEEIIKIYNGHYLLTKRVQPHLIILEKIKSEEKLTKNTDNTENTKNTEKDLIISINELNEFNELKS